ncbi:hypothetical protein N7539_008145 [Penicillium diatomitis]|uniref:Uncharacterized protein n=1 Tax=Penicillium diatomitis TaxID=2819901 RepID=A0A9X0BN05_9EURO|nr:uncharacterized protein N7539_008145 [Penicillium diatomitis]KAJ5475079.1 hypothetical protein N7539_008145 [Penicillium diatomitis]
MRTRVLHYYTLPPSPDCARTGTSKDRPPLLIPPSSLPRARFPEPFGPFLFFFLSHATTFFLSLLLLLLLLLPPPPPPTLLFFIHLLFLETHCPIIDFLPPSLPLILPFHSPISPPLIVRPPPPPTLSTILISSPFIASSPSTSFHHLLLDLRHTLAFFFHPPPVPRRTTIDRSTQIRR